MNKHQATSRIAASAVFVFAIVTFLGTTAHADPPQCAKDSDCAGEELCVDGKCVAPGGVTAPDPPPEGGCQKDTDCKQDRICVDGVCVDPPGSQPAQPPAQDPNTIQPVEEPVAPVRKVWRGSGGGASVRVVALDDRFSSGTVTVQGVRMTLRSSGRLRGSFDLTGKAGSNYARLRCRMNSSRSRATCTIDGAVNRRTVGGSVTIR